MKPSKTPDSNKLFAFRIFWSKAMNKKRLNDALESCLEALEREKSIDSVLVDYPHLDKTLRPVLEVSLWAMGWDNSPVPEDAIARGREKLFRRLEKLQNERTYGETTISLPSIVQTIKHTWKSIRLPLFINHHTRQSLSESSMPHRNKASEEDDHMRTHQQ